MAYLATITESEKNLPQGRETIITVVETGVVDNTHVVTIPVPVALTFTASVATLVAGGGTATVIDTKIGETNATAEIFDNGAAAATTRSLTAARVLVPGCAIYLRSMSDGTTSGDTGKITTTIAFLHGHLP